MALSSRLEMRQGQSLVMTPQLQQAIKLLQLSNMELMEFVDEELERNPLLEHSDADNASEQRTDEPAAAEPMQKPDGESISETGTQSDEGLDLTTNQVQRDTESVFDTEPENVFPESADPASPSPTLSDWSSVGSGQGAGPVSGESSVNLEAFVAEEINLQDHLMAQLPLAITDPVKRLIGDHLIDMVA